jgi:hypothetical protein
MNISSSQRTFVSASHAAQLLNLSESTILGWIQTKRLQADQEPDGGHRIPLTALDAAYISPRRKLLPSIASRADY